MILDEGEAAAAGSNLNADLLPLFDREIFYLDAGIVDCFARGRQRQWHGPRHMFAILRAKLRFPIKVDHLCGDLHRRLRNVERFDPTHSARAGFQSVPEGLAADSDGRDTTESGNDNPARMGELIEHGVSLVGIYNW